MGTSWTLALFCILAMDSAHCLPLNEEKPSCASYNNTAMLRSFYFSMEHLREHPHHRIPLDPFNPVREFAFEDFSVSTLYYRCRHVPQFFFWMELGDVSLNVTFTPDTLHAAYVALTGFVEDSGFCDLHDATRRCVYDRVYLSMVGYEMMNDLPRSLLDAAANGLVEIIKQYLQGK